MELSKTKEILSFAEANKILKSSIYDNGTTIVVGITKLGNPVFADLKKECNVIISGTTGSGKTVFLDNSILSLISDNNFYKNRLLLIDVNGIDFLDYNGIHNLLVPVITTERKAVGAISWLNSEVKTRLNTFYEIGVRNIDEYNEYCRFHPQMNLMPNIFMFIANFYALNICKNYTIENDLINILQNGIKTGVCTIISTSRASTDVIPGTVKSNIRTKIAFRTASSKDSIIAIDSVGAEKLKGNGELLFKPFGVSATYKVQGVNVLHSEVRHIVAEHLDVHQKINSLPKDVNIASPAKERDAMFESAVEVVVELGQASTTLLQRKLRLGYARAAIVMEQLEESGIVGPQEGSKPRKVLLTKQQLLEMKALAENSDE